MLQYEAQTVLKYLLYVGADKMEDYDERIFDKNRN